MSLGLLGAGGAIVAVPAFVYIGGIEPTLASGYAFFAVMVATGVACIPHIWRGTIHWSAFWLFGLTTMLTIFTIRRWILPALPQNIVVGSINLELNTVLMVCFGIVLLLAGSAMLRDAQKPGTQAPSHPIRLAALGIVVGIVAGFLGVGGGFLMTPALVIWAGLDMKSAVATSLALICVNSAVGVIGDLSASVSYDWPVVLTFTACACAGIAIGLVAAHRIDAQKLRTIFGWVVVSIGVVVLTVEMLSA